MTQNPDKNLNRKVDSPMGEIHLAGVANLLEELGCIPNTTAARMGIAEEPCDGEVVPINREKNRLLELKHLE